MRFGCRDLCAYSIWPDRALVNPTFDGLNLIVGQATAHRHARNIANTGDALIKMALGRVPRHNRLGKHRLFRIQTQTRHLRLGTVAHDARLGENRLNITHEIYFCRLGHWSRRLRCRETCAAGKSDSAHNQFDR
jgi:hypothetical protein